MPTHNEHLTQARHNHDFWTSLYTDPAPYLDWVVTGMFYEGVHWAEAVLSTLGEHSIDHRERSQAVRRHPAELGPIAVDLEMLKNESENARYMCYKHTRQQVSRDLVPLVTNISNYVMTNFGA